VYIIYMRTYKHRKHKRSKHKQSKHKQSKHKQSHKKRKNHTRKGGSPRNCENSPNKWKCMYTQCMADRQSRENIYASIESPRIYEAYQEPLYAAPEPLYAEVGRRPRMPINKGRLSRSPPLGPAPLAPPELPLRKIKKKRSSSNYSLHNTDSYDA
jgi:hypothetical protein